MKIKTKEEKQMINLYKYLLSFINLSGISLEIDYILCGGVFLCWFINGLIWFVLVSLITKILTKKTIFYWINKMI